MLAHRQASLGQKLESLFKKLFLYFHFQQNLQDQSQNEYSYNFFSINYVSFLAPSGAQGVTLSMCLGQS